jgi:hypothetical protein
MVFSLERDIKVTTFIANSNSNCYSRGILLLYFSFNSCFIVFFIIFVIIFLY